MSKPKVLVSDPISQTGVDALAEGGLLDVTFSPGLPHEELLKIIPEFSALVVRSSSWSLLQFSRHHRPERSALAGSAAGSRRRQ